MAMNFFSSSDFLPTLDSLCCVESDMRNILSVEHLQLFNCCSGEVGTEWAPWILRVPGRNGVVEESEGCSPWDQLQKICGSSPFDPKQNPFVNALAPLRWGGLLQEGGFYKKTTSVQAALRWAVKALKGRTKAEDDWGRNTVVLLVLWIPPTALPPVARDYQGSWAALGGSSWLASPWGKSSSFFFVLLLADKDTNFWHFGGGVKTNINIWK